MHYIGLYLKFNCDCNKQKNLMSNNLFLTLTLFFSQLTCFNQSYIIQNDFGIESILEKCGPKEDRLG